MDKELYYLFVSYIVSEMHDENSVLTKDLKRRVKLFKSKARKYLVRAIKDFEELEQRSKEEPPSKFKSKLQFESNGDLLINGKVFAACLILEHRNLKNRKLYLPYKIAEDILGKLWYNSNAHILAARYSDYLQEMK